MQVQSNGVRGKCYIVTKNNTSAPKSPEDILNSQASQLNYSKLELYLNLES